MSRIFGILPAPTSNNPRTWFNDNFHVVEEGHFYRSKTLSASSLKKYVKNYGIKTILNLREKDLYAQWYKDESAIAQKNNTMLVTITLNGRMVLTKDQLAAILKVFHHAPKPILVHCQAGADRTGFASALWCYEMMGMPLEKSIEQQLTWTCGHYSFWYPSMKKSLRKWHKAKRAHNNDHQKALDSYNPKTT